MESKSISVGVIGAGIQGVCISLFLIKKGFKVTLIDREEPGTNSASYGNAGHFSPYASVPINRPDILIDVPAMLLSTTGPLSLKWNYVPKMIPWFLKFIKNCTKKNMMHTAKYMHQILDLALPAYDELFKDINISGLVENKGIIYFWTDKNFIVSTFCFLKLPPRFKNKSNNLSKIFLGFLVCRAPGYKTPP